ncbi:MAG TPA: preprotein translocase subunit SecG [Verrucomicrobiae bacterium]|jgi:preprotein translocase subunit SecG|nr:preprotein translocase subunit SecG [Verrucomicrobiae bacterium]
MPREVKWAISLAVGLGLLWIGWKVYFVLVTLHIVICALLIAVIMLQSGEAADLAGAFGGAGSQTAFGPRGAATFLSKATTWCAIMFMLTSMALTMHVNNTEASAGSSILQQFSKTSKSAPAVPPPAAPAPVTPMPAPAPAVPAPAPAAPAPSK